MNFICPVCKGSLSLNNNSYICENGHCFDRSKNGYVNLLCTSKGGNHGDNKLMAKARKSFLDGEYYQRLQSEIISAVKEYCPSDGVVIDCGCGEGYYTSAVARAVPNASVSAFDISKEAVGIATKREGCAEYAVASSFDIPFKNESADVLLEIFSPFCRNEFFRVLKTGGFMIMAIPLENHLFDLKKAVYDEPYKNEVSDYDIDGFQLVKKNEIKYNFMLDSNEEIKNLFMMTPYYYKTGRKEQARLEALHTLCIQAEFAVLIYKKR